MNIAGMGIVFTRGRGISSFDEALRQGWKAPLFIEQPFHPASQFPIYAVDSNLITDQMVLAKTRRADRFCKMAVLAAWDALEDSGLQLGEDKKASLGIIVSTALGPHVTTFHFLDDILDYGDANVSPINFSHSVHNAAASYIASVLGSRGPTLTLTQFIFSFQQALLLAKAWLDEGRCEYILLGCVDECGPVMEYICQQKLHLADDGKIKPLCFSKIPSAVPGEGSVFFLLTLKESQKTYAQIKQISFNNDNLNEDHPDMSIIDADGLGGDESRYLPLVKKDFYIAGYAPIFGGMMIGSGFNCAAAALMLQQQVRYACPVQDNPYGITMPKLTEKAALEKIQCLRYDCNNDKAVITLQR